MLERETTPTARLAGSVRSCSTRDQLGQAPQQGKTVPVIKELTRQTHEKRGWLESFHSEASEVFRRVDLLAFHVATLTRSWIWFLEFSLRVVEITEAYKVLTR